MNAKMGGPPGWGNEKWREEERKENECKVCGESCEGPHKEAGNQKHAVAQIAEEPNNPLGRGGHPETVGQTKQFLGWILDKGRASPFLAEQFQKLLRTLDEHSGKIPDYHISQLLVGPCGNIDMNTAGNPRPET